MLQKVISKKRRTLSGHVRTEEHVVRCTGQAELLKALTGYRINSAEEEAVPPELLLELFDPCRPHRVITLHSATGITDNISVHTLH